MLKQAVFTKKKYHSKIQKKLNFVEVDQGPKACGKSNAQHFSGGKCFALSSEVSEFLGVLDIEHGSIRTSVDV